MKCSECNGTGKYVGLNEIEECKTCGGNGQTFAEADVLYGYRRKAKTDRIKAIYSEALGAERDAKIASLKIPPELTRFICDVGIVKTWLQRFNLSNITMNDVLDKLDDRLRLIPLSTRNMIDWGPNPYTTYAEFQDNTPWSISGVMGRLYKFHGWNHEAHEMAPQPLYARTKALLKGFVVKFCRLPEQGAKIVTVYQSVVSSESTCDLWAYFTQEIKPRGSLFDRTVQFHNYVKGPSAGKITEVLGRLNAVAKTLES